MRIINKSFSIVMLLVTMLVLNYPLYAQQVEIFLIRITPTNESELDKLDDLHLDYAYRGQARYVDILVDEAELQEIQSRGFKVELLPPLDKANLFDPEYHTYEEMKQELDSLAALYPDLTAIHQIGVGQRYQLPIWAIKISDNADIDEDEFTVNYDGVHHAREPIGCEICLLLAKHLLSNYGSDPEITEIVDNVEIWITPVLNTEGYKYLFDNDLDYPYWRKNQRDNNENGEFDSNVDGVDLNRNYNYFFDNSGSTNFSSNTFRGPYGFSESETSAKRDLTLEQRFLCSVTYHSQGERVDFMGGLEGSTIPETPILDAFADSISSRIPNLYASGHYYRSLRTKASNMSYPWMFAVAGVYEVLIETCIDTWIPTGPVAQRVAQDNLNGAMYLLEKTIAGPGIKGHVTDGVTNEPVVADVKILEYYRRSMTPRKSEAAYGRFHRFAAPGNYTLEVSAFGYEDKIVENVDVESSGWTDAEIGLDWAGAPVVDSYIIDDDSLGESLGNNDGFANINETIEVQIGLKNIGHLNIDGITATLQSLDSYATVIQNHQEFGAIPKDSVIHSSGKFVLHVDSSTPDAYELPFKMKIFGVNGQSWQDEFTIRVLAPVLDYQQVVVHDSLGNNNDAMEPEETVDLEVVLANNGHMDASVIHAQLEDSGGIIKIIEGSDTAAGIKVGEEGSLFFKVRVPENAPDPYLANFNLSVNSQEQYSRTLTFQLAGVAGFFDTMEFGKGDWWSEVRGNPDNYHNDWQWGRPQGRADGQDPSGAFSGTYCWSNDLGSEGWNGYYENNMNVFLNSPVIDCSRYSDVGLKFMRWLSIQEGDTACIQVNGVSVWSNHGKPIFDRQWNEQFLDIASIGDGNSNVVISFGLTSYESSKAGGWNIDDVLVKDQLMSGLPRMIDQNTTDEFILFQNYPNPFNAGTTIRYQLPAEGRVVIKIFNIIGQESIRIFEKFQGTGKYEIAWNGQDQNGRNVASGIYFVNFEVSTNREGVVFRKVQKLMYVK